MKQRLLTAALIAIALTACIGACARVDSLWHNQVPCECDCERACADTHYELNNLLELLTEDE